jgi:hypothetical protein
MCVLARCLCLFCWAVFACGIRSLRRHTILVLFLYGSLRRRTVPYGVVRRRKVYFFGSVQCFVRSPARVSYGARAQSSPYSTYGAPPSHRYFFGYQLHVSSRIEYLAFYF